MPEQVEDVAAGGLAVVAQCDDAADLAEGEADGLGGADERQPFERGRFVVAVARRGARRWLDQADVFVVADRLGRHPGPAGQVPDTHPCLSLTFLCTGRSSVVGMDIDLLYVPNCPHRETARRHLDTAIAEQGLAAVVREREIASPDDADRFGMHGSPTIR